TEGVFLCPQSSPNQSKFSNIFRGEAINPVGFFTTTIMLSKQYTTHALVGLLFLLCDNTKGFIQGAHHDQLSVVQANRVSRGGGWFKILRMSKEPLGFESEQQYLEHLESQAALPEGFQIGVTGFEFRPVELPSSNAKMKLTAIVLDEPTDAFAACFTKNRFPGSPVLVGRERLKEEKLQAIVVNNKISNVCPGGNGVADSEAVCAAMAETFGFAGGAQAVLPSSTGVIGWRLPVADMVANLPALKDSLQHDSLVPAAIGICTTDRYPKLRGAALPGGGRLVGIAKGAGMIEPNMATMLVYLLTDVAVPRATLRELLPAAVGVTFNCISVDSDESTSDTVALVSSRKVPLAGEAHLAEFRAALHAICRDLAKEVVRNGEGTSHVLEVAVKGCWSDEAARAIGKAVVNSPLFKCAVAGNDPNVGRLIAVVGKTVGRMAGVPAGWDPLGRARFSVAGETVFAGGRFDLNAEKEERLFRKMKEAQLLGEIGEHLTYPPHDRVIAVEVDLGAGDCAATTWGSDLTAEYVSINADYRS
ncbi:unnamed protein product, partial [Heterosigma akashiwo]